MKRWFCSRTMKLLASGGLLLQVGGCTESAFFDLLQTALLGVTAAGSWAILQNI